MEHLIINILFLLSYIFEINNIFPEKLQKIDFLGVRKFLNRIGNQQTCFTKITVSRLLFELQTSFCACSIGNESTLQARIGFIAISLVACPYGDFYESF